MYFLCFKVFGEVPAGGVATWLRIYRITEQSALWARVIFSDLSFPRRACPGMLKAGAGIQVWQVNDTHRNWIPRDAGMTELLYL